MRDYNEMLISKRIEDYRDLDALLKNYKNMYDDTLIKRKYKQIIEEIDTLITDEDYEKALTVCNLKTEIIPGLTNIYLDKNYEEKALYRLKIDEEIKGQLIRTHFNSIAEQE